MNYLLLTSFPRNQHRALTAVAVVFSLLGTCRGDDAAGLEFFEKNIRPVLIQSCYECHSSQEDKPKGGLRLDSREAARTGGDSGAAIVPGEPGESLLIEAMRHESFEMPPQAKLSDETIADFVKWIEIGAPDPRDRPDSSTVDNAWPVLLNARRDWWSLQPVVRPAVPEIETNPPRGTIDCFVLAKLEDAGLGPPKKAAPRTLIRRLSLVLTGLPPTPEAVQRFLRDNKDNPNAAYESLVDRLLDSPHFGERWARHWMDVVRFTETHGNEWNYEVHHAWRYRDYLIRAFNADVPYDQFVREHIAGDLLEQPRWNNEQQLNESLIGTSFYRFGEVNHDDCVTLTSIGYDILDNQIDTLTKAFQATTVACARCHDHKMDAVSAADYYALLGILKSSRLTAHTLDAPTVNAELMEQLSALKTQLREELARHWQSQTGNDAKYLLAAQAQIAKSPDAEAWAAGLSGPRLAGWVKALSVEKPDIDHPARAWQTVIAAKDVAATWHELATTFETDRQSHETFNAEQFVRLADFRADDPTDWSATGQGLRQGHTSSGEFTVAHEGDNVVRQILTAGRYTHVLSEKLNGTLRSPVIGDGKSHISFQVLGEKTSAVRLVSNNCQLNYANYRALTSPQPTWVTFKVPSNAEMLRTFAELVTKFDNPKFPDQLGTLGGDKTNDRIPWSEAATDPRSYFGILQVVAHDGGDPPKPDLSPLARLYVDADTVVSPADIADKYSAAIQTAVEHWSAGTADDDDVYWLSWCVNNSLLDHAVTASPQIEKLVDAYRHIEEQLARPRLSAGIADLGAGQDHRVLLRGNFVTLGDVVPRRYLEVLSTSATNSHPTGSGRRELADQIASSHNPLTARVMVNRVWHHMFGAGIVRSVDDFGHVGDLPSHPQLLDHLAGRFVEPEGSQGDGMGWSVKALIREIALSRTFRATSRAESSTSEIDPQNRLLHHYPVRRMEAEAIRDSILATSGRLQPTLFGESIQPFRAESNATRRLFAGPLDGEGRRSVYIKVNLMEGPKFLSAFNIPGGKITQGRRDVTNVPAQALTLLNDSFVLQQAGVWAEAAIQDDAVTVGSRLATMFEAALGRPATPLEIEHFEKLIGTLSQIKEIPRENILSSKEIWQDVAHILFNGKEFIYIP